MKSITELTDVRGRYVILRTSLNLPLVDGVVANQFRLKKALPTMRYLHEAGARTIVIGHIGRAQEDTLRPVYDALSDYLPVQWGGKIGSAECNERRQLMADGDLLLLENVRQDVRETNADPTYSAEICALGEVFVFDAFAVAHRAQASTVGPVEHLPSYAGLTMIDELAQLKRAMKPAAPALFLLGGAKFDTKLPLVERYLETYSHVFIGGALANDMLKARGYSVGASLLSDTDLTNASFLTNPKLILPVDLVVEGSEGRRTCSADQVAEDERILDAGPQTVSMLRSYIAEAATILWNGPLGHYEGGFTDATEAVAKLVAESTATSIIGGGDTVAAVEKLGLNDQFTHVSIGGGAMLRYLETGTLPVVDALEASEQR